MHLHTMDITEYQKNIIRKALSAFCSNSFFEVPLPDNCFLCSYASYINNLPFLKWLRAHGCQWNAQTCRFAALFNYYDIFVYAHTNGCPLDVYVPAYAAMNGNIDILKYINDNHCYMDYRTCAYATLNNDEHITLNTQKIIHNKPCSDWPCINNLCDYSRSLLSQ